MKNCYVFSFFLCLFCSFSHAQTIFQENFDAASGTTPPSSWTNAALGTNTSARWGFGQGSIFNPASIDGTPMAFFDDDNLFDGDGGEVVELTSPIIDLGSYSTVFVSFDYNFKALNTASDFFAVEVFNGTSFVNVLTVNTDDCGAWSCGPSYPQATLDLTPHINANFQIRFIYDDGNAWSWYVGFDNLHIYQPSSRDAALLEITAPTQTGRANTSIALGNETVEVMLYNNGSSSLNNVPIAYSLDGAAAVTENFIGPLAIGDSATFTFSTPIDVSVANTYELAAWIADPSDNNNTNDTLSGYMIRQLANDTLSLPHTEDFELAVDSTYEEAIIGMYGIEACDFTPELSGGRARTNAGFASTKAITLDRSSQGITQTNSLSLTYNLSNTNIFGTDVLLDFAFISHGDESHTDDRIWIRGSDGNTFIEMARLDSMGSGSYIEVIGLNVTDSLQKYGHNFSTSFQIQVGQRDNASANSLTGDDGITVDYITLRKAPENDIGVTAILLPDGVCGASTGRVEILITNYTPIDQTGFDVSYRLNNGSIITENVGTDIFSGLSTFSYIFTTPVDINGLIDFEIQAWTDLGIDELPSNDSTTTSFENQLVEAGADQFISSGGNANIGGSPTALGALNERVYGYDAGSGTLIQFDPTDLNELDEIGPAEVNNIIGADFVDANQLFFLESHPDTSRLMFLFTQGNTLQTFGYPQQPPGHDWVSFTWDPILFGAYAVSSNGTIGMLNIIDGAVVVTAVDTIATPWLGWIGLDATRTLYGVDISSDSLVIIDKTTAAITPVGPLGLNANQILGGDFDPITNELYLNLFNQTNGQYEWHRVDPTTGAATYLSDSRNVPALGISTEQTFYNWSPTNTLNNPNIANPTATPDSTTTYTLSLTFANTSCSVADSVTVYVDEQPFPIRLLSFQAVPHTESILLSWQMETMDELAYFVLERQDAAGSFHTLAQQYPSANQLTYQHIDAFPLTGENHYRLKMVGQDGKSHYSNIVSATFYPQSLIQLYPNPTTGQVFIEGEALEGSVQLSLHNPNGQRVYSRQYDASAPPTIDISSLPPGIYFYHIENYPNSFSGKLIIQGE